MSASHILFGVLATVVILAALVVASRIPGFVQDERDHRDIGAANGFPIIVRSSSARPQNDNLGALSVTEGTLMGFGACLLVMIAVLALLAFGVIA